MSWNFLIIFCFPFSFLGLVGCVSCVFASVSSRSSTISTIVSARALCKLIFLEFPTAGDVPQIEKEDRGVPAGETLIRLEVGILERLLLDFPFWAVELASPRAASSKSLCLISSVAIPASPFFSTTTLSGDSGVLFFYADPPPCEVSGSMLRLSGSLSSDSPSTSLICSSIDSFYDYCSYICGICSCSLLFWVLNLISDDSLYFLISNALDTTIVDCRFNFIVFSPRPKLSMLASSFLDDYENFCLSLPTYKHLWLLNAPTPFSLIVLVVLSFRRLRTFLFISSISLSIYSFSFYRFNSSAFAFRARKIWWCVGSLLLNMF